MKRQRGESYASKNDRNSLTGTHRHSFRTRLPPSLDFFNREINGKGSLRNLRELKQNRDSEHNIKRNGPTMGHVFVSHGKKTRKRRSMEMRIMSATVAVLAISSIAGTSGVTMPLAKEALAQNADKDLGMIRSLRHRSLQSYNMQQCKIALSVGDIDRDNLLSKSEYLRFVNQFDKSNTNSAYIEVSNYDELPQNLKENFDSFSDPALIRIDIVGAKPGQTPTSAQNMQLNNLCSSTYSKLNDAEDQANPGPPDDTPDTGVDCNAAVDRGRCNVDLSVSDTNQNNLLDEIDYVKFVNRLSSNQYTDYQIERLPSNIKRNYYRFATTDGQVNIAGSKPGQRVSVDQDIFLNVFCCETDLAVRNPGSIDDDNNNNNNNNNGSGPATQAPTIDLFFCQRSMASSDLNRDNGLSKDEYVTFLNRLTNNQFIGKTYDSLDSQLKANFDKLVGDNGKIDIYGSKPGQAANFQNEKDLVNVCVETGNALNAGSGGVPTASPVQIVKPTVNPTNGASSKPTSSQEISPTFAPGTSEVYNSFIISNPLDLKAGDLIVGTRSRDGLDEAYGIFVQEAVNNYTYSEDLEIRALRQRKLAVDFLADSDQIYKIVNSDCPGGSSPSESCQTVFAKFQLSIDEENADEVSKAYSEYTQNQISEGILQVYLKNVDEFTPLTVLNASYPVQPPEDNANAPTGAPINNTNENKKKRRRGGSIAAWVIFSFLFAGAIVYVYLKGLPFKIPFKMPSFPNRKSARVGNQVDEDDDEEARIGLHDDDDASVGDKNAFGKDFGVGNRISLDDDDGQKEKNLFGFSSRNNRKNADIDVNYALDSGKDLGNSADAADDMYAFEEPSEIDSEADDQDDQISASGAEDNVFGEKAESNWGSNNVFESDSSGQGWGANGGEENFFRTSAFAEQEEREVSQSESEESESFSSEDDTYQSGDQDETTENRSSQEESGAYEELQQPNSFSGSSSADDSYAASSVTSSKMPSDLRMKNDDMDAAIDNGDWDAVVEAAKAFDKSDQDSSIAGSSKRMIEEVDDHIEDDEESYSDESYSDDESGTSVTTTSEDRRKRAEYRVQVEELVKIVLPDETGKVDAMMDQFKGREAELVSTLQTMEERSSNQRARAAVHKSKPPAQQRNAAYLSENSASIHGEGSTAGSAAIAAASLPIPAEGDFDESGEFEGSFEDEEFEDAEGSQYDDQSYYSEEGSGSFYSEEEEEKEESASRSYYTEDGSGARSFYSQEEGSPEEEEESFYEEGSQEASQEGSQEKSFYGQEEGESLAESYYSEEQEGSQSYYSGDESYVSGEGEEDSFYSEEESPDNEQQIDPNTRRSY